MQIEVPHNDPNFTARELVNLFKKADPEFLMNQDEYRQFKKFEDTLTVYRGVTQHSNLKGLSWTLNTETAEWFATRFGEDGMVNGKHSYLFYEEPRWFVEAKE